MNSQKRRKIPETSKLVSQLKKTKTEEELRSIQSALSSPSGQLLMEVITELLKTNIDISLNKTETEAIYSSPSFSEKQADGIGYRRSLRELIRLIGN